MRFGTVILAAGASTRMGRPKLLLPWGERTILAHLAEQWAALGAGQVAVVVEAKSPLEGHLTKVERIVNPQPELGMFGSVQCAAKWQGWLRELTHFTITLGDQPHVPFSTLQEVVWFAEQNPGYICQPSRNGRPRHPVMVPGAVFTQLAASHEPTLKDFLRSRESQRRTFESQDSALDLDIDTPEDYDRARKLAWPKI